VLLVGAFSSALGMIRMIRNGVFPCTLGTFSIKERVFPCALDTI
jgi:hypothetical protein